MTFVHRWTAPVVYGLGVTVTLSLIYTLFKVGEITDFPRIFKFVAMSLTPWFIMGYSVARQLLPDHNVIKRAPNLLLPVFEGILAVGGYCVLYMIGGELENHYANTALEALKLVASIIAARVAVRRIFRF